MAITINGNGTITGVSAGGLPDGSVDADTLASTLDLSGKTMTYGLTDSDLSGVSTGKVLQVVEDVYSGSYIQTSSTTYQTGLSVSITPSSTSSKILCFAHYACHSDSQLNRITRGGTQVAVNKYSLGTGGWSTQVTYAFDTPSTTSAVTYALEFRSNNGGTTYWGGDNYYQNRLIVMEIAG